MAGAVTPAVTTYRYVRGVLVAGVGVLVVSVLAETARTHWQTSLSAYYYTAAGHVLVAVLAAIGAGLIALRGYTDAEDVFLNLAGIAAPTVGFVPTPSRDVPPDQPAIVNNMVSYLAVLAVGVVVVAVIQRRTGPALTRWAVFGYAATAAAWVVGVVWIAVDRAGFCAHAHVLAAANLFGTTAVVVLLNTDWGLRRITRTPVPARTRFDRAYWAIVVAMTASTVAWLVVTRVVHVRWPYALLAQECVMLGLFAIFWVLQTVDLWDPERDLRRAAVSACVPS